MLANLLLCTGLCFIVGGIRTTHQEFDETVVETGGGLLLVSVAALVLPCAFASSISSSGSLDPTKLEHRVTDISRFTAALLLTAYAVYLFFQLSSHHFLFDRALYRSDLKAHADKERKQNLTITEGAVVTLISLGLVTLLAVLMVEQIPFIVEEKKISDAFMGLILVPLVEKAAEHLKGIDEAWNGYSPQLPPPIQIKLTMRAQRQWTLPSPTSSEAPSKPRSSSPQSSSSSAGSPSGRST